MKVCDICGSSIDGEPIIAEIDGAILMLCKSCARKYVSSGHARVISGSITTQKSTPQTPTYRVFTKTTQRGTSIRFVKTSPGVSIKEAQKYEIVEDYAELIRSAREALGMSRDMLAKILGVKESVIRRIEEGQLMPDLELARKIERILKIKLIQESEDFEIPMKRKKPELTLGDIVEIREKKD